MYMVIDHQYIIIIVYCIKGEAFQLKYLYLCELSSIIAPSVNIMALTAMASDNALKQWFINRHRARLMWAY